MAGAAEDYSPGRMLGLMARSLVLPTAAPAGAGVAADPAGGISVTYVGHATVLVRFDGVALLTDPVYSQRLILPKRLVEPGVPLAQLPPLDVVLVSHGHMDHLDVPTHRRLPKTDTVAVVAKNLSDLVAGCGYREVIELAWGDTVTVRGVRVTALPVKHWGTRNLWPDDRGYTGFLAGAELDHAQDILADLMSTVVGGLRPTFRLAKLEGDAAFAYAINERVDAAQLQDAIERCYFLFRRRLRKFRSEPSLDYGLPRLGRELIGDQIFAFEFTA